MSATDNEQDENQKDIKLNLMYEHLRNFSFQNSHVMRGPLCRALGLVNLLKRENLSGEARRLQEMLYHELTQMENVTVIVSRMLDKYERELNIRGDDDMETSDNDKMQLN